MYVYLYIYTYIFIYLYMYLYIYFSYLYVYTCICLFIYVYTYMYIYRDIYTCMYIYMYVYIYIYIYMCMYICIYIGEDLKDMDVLVFFLFREFRKLMLHDLNYVTRPQLLTYVMLKSLSSHVPPISPCLGCLTNCSTSLLLFPTLRLFFVIHVHFHLRRSANLDDLATPPR